MRRYSDLEIQSERFGSQGDPDVCITLLHDGTLDAFPEREIGLIKRCLHEDDKGQLEKYLHLERDFGSRMLAEVLKDELLEQATEFGEADLGIEILSDPRPRGIFDPNRVHWGMALRDVFFEERLMKDRELQSFLRRQQWIHERNHGDLVHHASRARFIVDQHTMAPRNPDVRKLCLKSNGAPMVIAANIHPGSMADYCAAYDSGVEDRVHADFLSSTCEKAGGRPDVMLVDEFSHRFFVQAYYESDLSYGANATYKLGSFTGNVAITSVDLLLAKPGAIFEDNKGPKGFWQMPSESSAPNEALIQKECKIRAQGILLSLKQKRAA